MQLVLFAAEHRQYMKNQLYINLQNNVGTLAILA